MWQKQIGGFLSPLALIMAVLLASCGAPAAGPTPTPPPEPVQAAVETFSGEAGIPVDEISITSFQETEWPDACLGLAEEGEMCAQVITSGWEIIVQAQGQEYEIRSDSEASVVRFPTTGQSNEASNPDSLY
jgi:hypothetical protein